MLVKKLLAAQLIIEWQLINTIIMKKVLRETQTMRTRWL